MNPLRLPLILKLRLHTAGARIHAIWQPFWTQRSSREQRILIGAGVFLSLVLLYTTAWEPAIIGRQQVARELPQLKSQLAEMENLALEARTLGTPNTLTLSAPALQEALQTSLRAKGLHAIRLSVIGEAPATVQLQLASVSFATWSTWLEDVRSSYRLKPTEASVRYVAAPGQVDLTVTLQGPRS